MIWAFLACSVVWTVAVIRLKVYDQTHHFFYGVWLYAVGYPIPGLVLMADDAIQHAAQMVWPRFRSPIHLAYGWVARKVARKVARR